MKQYIGSLLIVGTITVTTSCTTPSPTDSSQATLSKYRAATTKSKTLSINGIRHMGLRDAALSFGARGGLAWRADQINRLVMRHERHLDLIYNFNGILLDNNVLPPVLIEGRQTLDQSADDVIRVADRQYSIQSQARFVTMAPTWRDYLKMNYKEPDVPDSSLLPRDESEQGVWDRYLNEGWQAGVTQADVIFAENLGRLKRDYEGMVRYRTLLAQNMVSLPYVAQINLGVTGGDSQMAINDRILRITTLPQFVTASNEWRAQVTPDSRQDFQDLDR
jgi:defect-in-organelle-trafficking protein DotC